MTNLELENVKNFTIFNEYGKIVFPGYTNLKGLNIDEIVDISDRTISVYKTDPNIFHDRGEGLNKKAFITINNLFCSDDVYYSIKDEYVNLINKIGGYFISYNNKSGELEYFVNYFI